MLEIRNGKKAFENRVLFDNLNIKFPEKGFFMVVGPSGCGKSTLLKILSGLVSLDNGAVFYDGIKLKDKRDFTNFRKQHVSFIFQDYGLIENYSVYQNVKLPLLIRKDIKTNEKIKEALKKVGLTDKNNIKCQYLSGGEKQRVAIARVLVSDSDIIFSDEPSGSLDETNAIVVFEALKKISKTKLVICVTHNLELANKYGDYIYKFGEKYSLSPKPIKNEKKKIKFVNIPLDDRVKMSICSLFYRKMRMFLSILSYSLVVLFLLLTLSLSKGINDTLSDNISSYLNYNQINVSQSESSTLGDSGFSLIKMKRPSRNDLVKILQGYHYKISYSFDYLFSQCKFYSEDEELNLNFKPVDFIFNGKYEQCGALINKMTVNQVFVNQKAAEMIGDNLKIVVQKEIETYDEYFNKAVDNFYFEKDLIVIKIVKEFNFMAIPIVYYSYPAYEKYLMNEIIPNASYLYKKPISFFERLTTLSSDSEDVSSYAFLIFTDEKIVLEIKKVLESNNYAVSSYPLDNGKNLLDILNSIELILYIFTILSGVIVIFLVGMIMYSMVIDRRKEVGILQVIGIDTFQINKMFAIDGALISLISSVISIVSLHPLLKIINDIIERKIGIQNLLKLPYLTFYESGNLFFIIVIIICIILGLFLGFIPSLLSSKVEINEIMKED